MLPQIVCAVSGHSTPFILDVAHVNLDCVALEHPTIQDLLIDVAEYHELECGCGVVVSGCVWPTMASLNEKDSLLQNSAQTLPAHTSLAALRPARSGQVSLVVEAEDFGLNDFLRMARSKRFKSFTAEGATVFRRTGSEPVLPPATAPSFAALCTTPGSVFVDKSETVCSLLSKFPKSFVNAMRRPRGFGKSTLLSMLDAFFDPCTTCAHFPFTYDQAAMSGSAFGCRGQLLVFSLDLADLSPYTSADGTDDDMDEDKGADLTAILAKCDALLDAAAAKFCARYQEILQAPASATARPNFSATFDEILRWSKAQEYQLCFLIDNYTAPFITYADPGVHFSVTTVIFCALKDLVRYSTVRYAFLVGDEAPSVSRRMKVSGLWTDLTDDPDFSAAVGFTTSEVVALGQALSVDLPGALLSALREDQRTNPQLAYASADVLSLARQLLSTGAVSELPPISVWAMAVAEDEETRDRIFRRNCELLFGQDCFTDNVLANVDEDARLGRTPVVG
ncbi:hypothetical protein AURDEDRAFT_186384 [Auricularia subglabra TFB-10046 SS5]|nr:hypothetical protein AURDEDRAFT_186384 [Auricularia subglabra TFB-10046 SS5]